MIRILSHVFSWLLLPLFMPLYGLLIAMYYPSMELNSGRINIHMIPEGIKWKLFAVFSIFSCVAPGISYVGLHKFKIISTLDMENKEERHLPLILMFIYGILLYILFVLNDPNHVLPSYYFSLTLSGVFVTGIYMIITRYIKISMHAGGAGILCGFLFSFFQRQMDPSILWMVLSLISAGLVIGSRYYLEKHTPKELFWGITIAFCVTSGLVAFYP